MARRTPNESIADGNTIVITCKHLAKLGALLFGPVWVPPRELQELSTYSGGDKYGEDQPPQSLIMCTAEDAEVYQAYCNADQYKDPDSINPMGLLLGPGFLISRFGTDIAKDKVAENYKKKGYRVIRLGHAFDNPVSIPDPVTNIDLVEGGFSEGTKFLVHAAIKKLPMVNSSKTDWSQIIEFKDDKKALRKYRNLRLWLSEGVNTSSLDQARDVLEKRIDEYEWAIQKHGLETAIGFVDEFVDPKTLIAAATGAGLGQYLEGPIMAALAGGLVLAGKLVLFAAKRRLANETLRQYNKENDVALLYEAMERFGTTQSED